MKTRTRFAPSPTGFIHLGNIRSALYPWAFARATGGDFILRIEDTDEDRSTQAAVDVIIDGMAWLGLNHDEGPFYQMQRMARYKEVLAQLQTAGHVYPCYMSVAELDALREQQMANKQKPRYDGTWRPEAGKALPPIPDGVQPVLRFKNPIGGAVVWDDKVKGRIEISNDELDDLVIASFVSGPGSSTLPMIIFSKVRLGVAPEVNALATIIIGVVAVGVAVIVAAASAGSGAEVVWCVHFTSGAATGPDEQPWCVNLCSPSPPPSTRARCSWRQRRDRSAWASRPRRGR